MSTKNKDILILSSYDNAYEDCGLGPLSKSKNKEYADKHGYSFRCECEPMRSHYFFHKFHLLKELLDDYKWVFWIDADAFIVNHETKIQDFIPEDNNKIFVAAIDQEYLNTGVFLIKNDPVSHKILEVIINDGPRLQHPFPDALVLTKIFEQRPDIIDWIKPQKRLNAYKYELYKDRMDPNPDGEYDDGTSFVLHFPGMPLTQRVDSYHKFNVKEMT